MSKYYVRGKFVSSYKPFVSYIWTFRLSTLLQQLEFYRRIGRRIAFLKVLIVRGIGFRVFALQNDFAGLPESNKSFLQKIRPIYSGQDAEIQNPEINEINQILAFDLPYARYVLIRAGHTSDLNSPLHTSSRVRTSKKDRKLVISSPSSMLTSDLAKKFFSYRPPSVYTGRGVRLKHVRPIRKAGKKDRQKGRAF